MLKQGRVTSCRLRPPYRSRQQQRSVSPCLDDQSGLNAARIPGDRYEKREFGLRRCSRRYETPMHAPEHMISSEAASSRTYGRNFRHRRRDHVSGKTLPLSPRDLARRRWPERRSLIRMERRPGTAAPPRTLRVYKVFVRPKATRMRLCYPRIDLSCVSVAREPLADGLAPAVSATSGLHSNRYFTDRPSG